MPNDYRSWAFISAADWSGIVSQIIFYVDVFVSVYGIIVNVILSGGDWRMLISAKRFKPNWIIHNDWWFFVHYMFKFFCWAQMTGLLSHFQPSSTAHCNVGNSRDIYVRIMITNKSQNTQQRELLMILTIITLTQQVCENGHDLDVTVFINWSVKICGYQYYRTFARHVDPNETLAQETGVVFATCKIFTPYVKRAEAC